MDFLRLCASNCESASRSADVVGEVRGSWASVDISRFTSPFSTLTKRKGEDCKSSVIVRMRAQNTYKNPAGAGCGANARVRYAARGSVAGSAGFRDGINWRE